MKKTPILNRQQMMSVAAGLRDVAATIIAGMMLAILLEQFVELETISLLLVLATLFWYSNLVIIKKFHDK